MRIDQTLSNVVQNKRDKHAESKLLKKKQDWAGST